MRGGGICILLPVCQRNIDLVVSVGRECSFSVKRCRINGRGERGDGIMGERKWEMGEMGERKAENGKAGKWKEKEANEGKATKGTEN